MLPESGEVLCAACAARPFVFGLPNAMVMGYVAAGRCLCTYWCMWVLLWLLCSFVVRNLPQTCLCIHILKPGSLQNYGGRKLKGLLF